MSCTLYDLPMPVGPTMVMMRSPSRRGRSERSELEAAACVLEEDRRIDSADVAVAHETLCCLYEVGALSLLWKRADLPRSIETPFRLGAVLLVLFCVSFRCEQSSALEDRVLTPSAVFALSLRNHDMRCVLARWTYPCRCGVPCSPRSSW